MKSLVLYAHPDRWTVGAEFPPEEEARMRAALLGFAWEWLKARRGSVKVTTPRAKAIRDTPAQQAALARWKDRRSRLTPAVLEAALDAVLLGALWESPVFARTESALRFHRAWRILLEVEEEARSQDIATFTKRWNLIPRGR